MADKTFNIDVIFDSVIKSTDQGALTRLIEVAEKLQLSQPKIAALEAQLRSLGAQAEQTTGKINQTKSATESLKESLLQKSRSVTSPPPPRESTVNTPAASAQAPQAPSALERRVLKSSEIATAQEAQSQRIRQKLDERLSNYFSPEKVTKTQRLLQDPDATRAAIQSSKSFEEAAQKLNVSAKTLRQPLGTTGVRLSDQALITERKAIPVGKTEEQAVASLLRIFGPNPRAKDVEKNKELLPVTQQFAAALRSDRGFVDATTLRTRQEATKTAFNSLGEEFKELRAKKFTPELPPARFTAPFNNGVLTTGDDNVLRSFVSEDRKALLTGKGAPEFRVPLDEINKLNRRGGAEVSGEEVKAALNALRNGPTPGFSPPTRGPGGQFTRGSRSTDFGPFDSGIFSPQGKYLTGFRSTDAPKGPFNNFFGTENGGLPPKPPAGGGGFFNNFFGGGGGGGGNQGPPGFFGSIKSGFVGKGGPGGFFSGIGEQIGGATRSLLTFAVAGGAVAGVLGLIKKGFGAFLTVNDQIIDLNKILQTSQANLTKLKDAAVNTSKEFGVSISEVLQGFRIFAQQGRSTEEVIKFGKIATLGSNVSQLPLQKITEVITTGLTTFGDKVGEGASKLIDSFLAVEGKNPVSESDLADVFLRVGPQAKTAGVSLDELNSLATVIKETTRVPSENIARVLRTVFKNVQDVKKLKTLQKDLAGTEFAPFDETGQPKAAFDLLGDLSKIFNKGTKIQKNVITRALGDKQFFSQTTGLLSEFGKTEDIKQTSANAEGEALKRNDIIQEKIGKKAEKLGASFEALGIAIFNGIDKPLKDALDTLTSFTDKITSSIELIRGKGEGSEKNQGFKDALGFGRNNLFSVGGGNFLPEAISPTESKLKETLDQSRTQKDFGEAGGKIQTLAKEVTNLDQRIADTKDNKEKQSLQTERDFAAKNLKSFILDNGKALGQVKDVVIDKTGNITFKGKSVSDVETAKQLGKAIEEQAKKNENVLNLSLAGETLGKRLESAVKEKGTSADVISGIDTLLTRQKAGAQFAASTEEISVGGNSDKSRFTTAGLKDSILRIPGLASIFGTSRVSSIPGLDPKQLEAIKAIGQGKENPVAGIEEFTNTLRNAITSGSPDEIKKALDENTDEQKTNFIKFTKPLEALNLTKPGTDLNKAVVGAFASQEFVRLRNDFKSGGKLTSDEAKGRLAIVEAFDEAGNRFFGKQNNGQVSLFNNDRKTKGLGEQQNLTEEEFRNKFQGRITFVSPKREPLPPDNEEFLRNITNTGFGAGQVLKFGGVFKDLDAGASSFLDLTDRAAGTFEGFTNGVPKFNTDLQQIFSEAAKTQEGQAVLDKSSGTEKDKTSAAEIKKTNEELEAVSILAKSVDATGRAFKGLEAGLQSFTKFLTSQKAAIQIPITSTGVLNKLGEVPGIAVGKSQNELSPQERAFQVLPQAFKGLAAFQNQASTAQGLLGSIAFDKEQLKRQLEAGSPEAKANLDESLTKAGLATVGPNDQPLTTQQKFEALSSKLDVVGSNLENSFSGAIRAQAAEAESIIRVTTALAGLEQSAKNSATGLRVAEKVSGAFDVNRLAAQRGEGPFAKLGENAPRFFRQEGKQDLSDASKIDFGDLNSFEQQRKLVSLRSAPEVRKGFVKILDENHSAIAALTEDQAKVAIDDINDAEEKTKSLTKTGQKNTLIQQNQEVAKNNFSAIEELIQSGSLPKNITEGLGNVQDKIKRTLNKGSVEDLKDLNQNALPKALQGLFPGDKKLDQLTENALSKIEKLGLVGAKIAQAARQTDNERKAQPIVDALRDVKTTIESGIDKVNETLVRVFGGQANGEFKDHLPLSEQNLNSPSNVTPFKVLPFASFGSQLHEKGLSPGGSNALGRLQKIESSIAAPFGIQGLGSNIGSLVDIATTANQGLSKQTEGPKKGIGSLIGNALVPGFSAITDTFNLYKKALTGSFTSGSGTTGQFGGLAGVSFFDAIKNNFLSKTGPEFIKAEPQERANRKIDANSLVIGSQRDKLPFGPKEFQDTLAQGQTFDTGFANAATFGDLVNRKKSKLTVSENVDASAGSLIPSIDNNSTGSFSKVGSFDGFGRISQKGSLAEQAADELSKEKQRKDRLEGSFNGFNVGDITSNEFFPDRFSRPFSGLKTLKGKNTKSDEEISKNSRPSGTLERHKGALKSSEQFLGFVPVDVEQQRKEELAKKQGLPEIGSIINDKDKGVGQYEVIDFVGKADKAQKSFVKSLSDVSSASTEARTVGGSEKGSSKAANEAADSIGKSMVGAGKQSAEVIQEGIRKGGEALSDSLAKILASVTVGVGVAGTNGLGGTLNNDLLKTFTEQQSNRDAAMELKLEQTDKRVEDVVAQVQLYTPLVMSISDINKMASALQSKVSDLENTQSSSNSRLDILNNKYVELTGKVNEQDANSCSSARSILFKGSNG